MVQNFKIGTKSYSPKHQSHTDLVQFLLCRGCCESENLYTRKHFNHENLDTYKVRLELKVAAMGMVFLSWSTVSVSSGSLRSST